MPISKHHTKKLSNRERKKLNNTRKHVKKFMESKKRKAELKTMTMEERDAKFFKVFPRAKESFK